MGAKSFVVIRINAQDGGCDMLVFLRAGCRFGTEVLVIGASVDPEEPAESFDTVLEAEFMYSV